MRRGFLIPVTALLFAMPVAAEPPPQLSGPYTHGNLAIFLMHGKDTLPAGAKLLTLQEALEKKLLIVHETSDVNELSVENVSTDVEVFIQSGDIVKGGKQDRLLARDMVVSPKSGKQPIASFCVEQGRWQQRGGEAAGRFSGSSAQAGNKGVKLAANAAMDQGEVWKNVKEAQLKLARNVGKNVANPQSPSSYQLTLEDKELIAKVDAYVKNLTPVAGEKSDSIGFVIVINGKVEGAESYGSHALFLKLWPKLIHGAAIDALAELDAKKKFDAPTAALVEQFLTNASKGAQKDVTAAAARQQTRSQPAAQAPSSAGTAGSAKPDAESRIKVTSVDNDKSIMLEAKDRKDGRVIHRSYIAK